MQPVLKILWDRKLSVEAIERFQEDEKSVQCRRCSKSFSDNATLELYTKKIHEKVKGNNF